MSYRALVQREIKRAFKLIKDIGVDCTFTSKSGTSYDFATHTTAHESVVSTTVKCIIKDKSKKTNKQVDVPIVHSSTIELITISESLPNNSIYDTVSVKGVVYNVVQPVVDDGYLLTITIKR